ncbi:MAG: hypothetical protein WC159_02650 [Sphaerochaetaceae bacterium]
MKNLSKIILLACVLVIAFVNPSAIGRLLYFGLFPIMFFMVWVYYHFSFAVSEHDVRKIKKEGFSCSFACGKIPQLGSGDLVRGRLVVTKDKLELYQRKDKGYSKEEPCSLAWSLSTSEIRSFGVGQVLSIRPGVIFYLDEGDVRFVHYQAKREKERIRKALGWDKIPSQPQEVEVFADAAQAPSFTSVNKDTKK